MPDTDELIKIDRVVVLDGDKHIKLTVNELKGLASELNDLLNLVTNDSMKVNPNQEPWPDHWSIVYGMLRQGNELVINL